MYDCRHRDIGPVHDMVADHLADIHLINMVAAKNRDIVGVGRFNKVQELIDRIGGAFEPLFAVAVGFRRNRVKELAMTDQPRPELFDMLVQRIGAVLSQDIDLLDTGVEQIVQNEIDDFVFAAERDAGFGAVIVICPSRSPLPPARTIAMVFRVTLPNENIFFYPFL